MLLGMSLRSIVSYDACIWRSWSSPRSHRAAAISTFCHCWLNGPGDVVNPTQRRIVGSIVLAVAFMLWISGDWLFQENIGGPAGTLIVLSLMTVVVYRMWPGLEISWAYWRTAHPRDSWRPTPRRILGTAVLASLWAVAMLVAFQRISPADPIDAVEVLKAFLIPLVLSYAWWPEIERKWFPRRAQPKSG